MAKLGILAIHGQGEESEDFDTDLREGLAKRLPFWQDIYLQKIYYHPAIADQEPLWHRMNAGRDLDWKRLRRFFLYGFSDAATYHWRPDSPDSAYRNVHQVIKDAMDNLQQQLEADGPVVIIAQSLGCQVISNYIWDAQKGKGIWEDDIPNDFHQFKTLKLMMTTGCNIPLFVSGFEEIVAFHRPHPEFKWFNFYDRDDMLGWPLKPLANEKTQGLDNAYDKVVTEDVEIDTGLTPFGHGRYWRDKDFLNPAARLIKDLAQPLLQQPQ